MTQYVDKAALVAEIERMKVDAIQFPFEEYGTVGTCNKLLSFLDTLEIKEVQEEPVSNTTLLYGLSGSVGIEEAVRATEKCKEWQGDPERQQSFIDFAKFGANYKHHTSNDLEEAAVEAFKQIVDTDKNNFLEIFKAGAEWKRGRMLDEDYAWAIYNFINKWKSGGFGEVSLQKALDDFGKDVQL